MNRTANEAVGVFTLPYWCSDWEMLLIELHWLPVAARIKFMSLMLAYRVLTGSAPNHLRLSSHPCQQSALNQSATSGASLSLPRTAV